MESGWLGDGCVQTARIIRATHLLHNTQIASVRTFQGSLLQRGQKTTE